jgi:DNA-binding XRE family transcriptional regulator
MQTWKMNIINKLSEKADESKEINLYETANELGYNDILIADTQDIINGFLEQNFNYKVIKNNPTGQLSNFSKAYLMPTIIFKELDSEELAKLNNLSKIRKNKGYTQSKLAEISGVNIRMIQKYESGERDFKKALVQTAFKIADALEVTVDELFVRI